MKAHSVNDLDNFIGGWYINPDLCDKLINYYEKNPNKYKGFVGERAEGLGAVNEESKKSTEVVLDLTGKNELCNVYAKQLQEVLDKYFEKYPWSNGYGKFKIVSNVAIQHYKPNEGFYVWHTERTGASKVASRHLVFMTYLNDVDNGGTEFHHQKLITQAEKGLTLIWPADWTFTHRGVISSDQHKYIITGWFEYY
jgi:hypothetical protein